MANHFMYFEQIIPVIHTGVFNEMMLLWRDGVDRAIINYIFETKSSLKTAASYFEMEENEVKKRIKNIVSYYDQMYNDKSHESFSKRGR